MNKTIDVEVVLYTSSYAIRKHLPKIFSTAPLLSFDVETRSVYKKEERGEATEYLKDSNPADDLYQQALVVSNSSGLSFPSIVKTTHFIFGESRCKAHVVVISSDRDEMFMWDLISKFKGKFLVHNSLFDLKIMYQRTGKLPENFVDTALIVKCFINHVNIWKAKTGLKVLMAEYYSPKWVLMNDYEPKNLKDKNFIQYAGIDGAATFHLYELILEEMKNG